MFIVEAYVLKTEEISVQNIVGLMLRDLESDLVDYYPLEKAVAECNAGKVNELDYIAGEFRFSPKSWWLAALGTKERTILKTQNNLNDRLITSYVMTVTEASAFENNCPVFIIGPAVKVPIQGIIAPTLCMCKNPRKMRTITPNFKVRKNRQGANYAEFVFRYSDCYNTVLKFTEAELLPVFSTVMAEVNPIDVAKSMGLNTKPLMSNALSESIQDQLSFLATVSAESLTASGCFGCVPYLKERLGDDFYNVPPASIADCKTKQDCDDLVNMIKNFIHK